MREVEASVDVAKATRLSHLAEEEELIELRKRPVQVRCREPVQEGGQVARLIGRQAFHLEQTPHRPG